MGDGPSPMVDGSRSRQQGAIGPSPMATANAIEVDFSLPGERVVEVLERVARERGYPDILVVDNGPELRGRALDGWADDHGVQLYFIDPFVGKTVPRTVF